MINRHVIYRPIRLHLRQECRPMQPGNLNEHVAKTRAISQSRKMLAQQQNVVWIFPPHAGAKLAAGAISKINQAEEGY